MTKERATPLRGPWSWRAGAPCDLGSEEGRARERHRRVAMSALASAVAKCLSIAATLVSVPLTLSYLGLERYGMWLTMSSVAAMLSFADLGIGNGLMSAVAEAHGRQDRVAIQRLISSAFLALGAIAILLLAAFSIAYSFIPWDTVLNVHSAQARQEAGPAIAVMMGCFALAIPGCVVQRAQSGLQAGFVASLWQCAASVLGLAGLVVAIRAEAGLPWLAFATFGTPLLASAGNSVHFFALQRRDLAPRLGLVDRATGLRLAKTGALFFVLQVVAAVTYASDAIVIAQRLGASAVAAYAVPEKMFSLVSAMLAIALTPLWPAYGEAFASGDLGWIRRTFRRSLLLTICAGASVSAILILLGPWLVATWVADAVAPTLLLLVGLGVWKTIEAGGNAAAMFLNGAGVIRFQLIVAVSTAVVAVILKVVLVDRIGVSGAVWASSIAYLLLAAIPTFILVRRGSILGRRVPGAAA